MSGEHESQMALQHPRANAAICRKTPERALMQDGLHSASLSAPYQNGSRICLISLYSSSSIGPRYLASLLKKNGFDVRMIFFKDKDIALDLMERPSSREYDLLDTLVATLNPDLVGISVRSSFLSIAKEITRRIQNKLNKPVIWGGTHASVAPDQSVQIADMVCLGEGEQAMLELASKFAAKEAISSIQNLWVRENGNITKNPVRPLWPDLDLLPFPDYAGDDKYFIHNDKVSSGDPGHRAFNLDVITSRGCPYRCSYCSNSILRDMYTGCGSVVRRRSPGNVLDEIKLQQERLPGLKRVYFIDEVFSWDKQWVEEFVDRYKREVRLPFHCMQHPNTVDEEIMRVLRDAGLERVEIGIQSGSERIRMKEFDRPVPDKKLISTSQILRRLKIVPFYDLIVDNPFETAEDKKQGLDFLLKMSRPFYMHMFSLIYFPNTVFTQKALAAGLITEKQVEGEATACFDQWYVSLNHPRPNADRFWLSLYSLTSKSFVPKALIRNLSRMEFLLTHPGLLVAFANLCNYLKLLSIGAKWILEGKPVLSSVRGKMKSKKQGSRIV
jgi:radical SAM superfamily enzyme YgiQ (UPF0313 family)